MAEKKHSTGVIDLTGQRFGRLTVIARAENSETRRGARWLCGCECGKTKIIPGNELRRGLIRSCTCLQKEVAGLHARNLTYSHGRRKSSIYNIWAAMLQRCMNPNNRGYGNYGGRGIKVCKRWLRFENFLTDMGERPTGMTLDRRNNNEGYSPANCRWATPLQQGNNSRKNRLLTYLGETRTLQHWADHLGINNSSLITRLARWPLEKALSTPARADSRRQKALTA
jgi:hypothetical protein